MYYKQIKVTVFRKKGRKTVNPMKFVPKPKFLKNLQTQ